MLRVPGSIIASGNSYPSYLPFPSMNADLQPASREVVVCNDTEATRSVMATVTDAHAECQPVVIILMGLPAAGKSTFYARELAPRGIEHINLDTLRTRHRELLQIPEYLKSGVSFAVDNTNTLPEERARYIELATDAGYRIEGYFLRSRVQECIRNNEERDKKVPIAAIASMSARLILPSRTEGFDALYFVNRTEKGYDISPWKEN